MNRHLSFPTEETSFFPANMWIESLDPKMIFVFGSNLQGVHGSGSARTAFEHFGAIYGKGEGLMGDSYALPTCVAPGRPLMLRHIELHVKKFREVVESLPHLHFVVTAVGTGYAGYNHHDIAPMFKGIPRCSFPDNWKQFLA